jgi:hypothetical protein
MITREQYDNAVKIRANGYHCLWLDIPYDKSCACCALAPQCGNEEPGNITRIKKVDVAISTYEAAHPKEFDPGEGWRWLEVDNDILRKGDDVHFKKIEYKPLNPELFGSTVTLPNTFRRRISKPRIYTYEDVNLPEVQALVGKMVYTSDCLERIMSSPENRHTLDKIGSDAYPFFAGRANWQFIRAIDPIRLTRDELITIAAKDRGVNPEQIVVEEAPDGR